MKKGGPQGRPFEFYAKQSYFEAAYLLATTSQLMTLKKALM
jgi:hypothetical protein